LLLVVRSREFTTAESERAPREDSVSIDESPSSPALKSRKPPLEIVSIEDSTASNADGSLPEDPTAERLATGFAEISPPPPIEIWVVLEKSLRDFASTEGDCARCAATAKVESAICGKEMSVGAPVDSKTAPESGAGIRL
jgi:hypothetical protein